MAQRVLTRLIDDVSGDEADQSVRFSLDGVDYEIDLSESNADALREAFSPWVEHARRLRGTPDHRSTARRTHAPAPQRAPVRTPSPPMKVVRVAPDAATLRQWGKKNGYKVSDHGRIPAAVLDAYMAGSV